MSASRTGERVREPARGRRDDLAQAARRPRGWKRELAVAVAVGAFLGVIGPFGSYSSGAIGERIAYWTACIVLGTLVFGTAVRIVASRRLARGRALTAAVALAALLAIPFSLLVAFPAAALWPATAEITRLNWYLQVLTVAAPLCAAWILLERRSRARASATADLRRQPGALGVESRYVLCLQMEDHYVRVHHATGSELVLTTMRQAQHSLGTLRGLQVHRSWWVAESAVEEALVDGRNMRLRLTNNLLVPVSRSAVAAVRAAGWLNRSAAS